MSVEQLLRQALHRVDDYHPSTDLFDRVRDSIEQDRVHRLRVRRAVAVLTAAGLAIVGYLWVMAEVVDGRLHWPWWSLEALSATVMVTIVVVLGPLIRRFGSIYDPVVFRAHPTTAGRFLALLDIAYYLVFAAYVLLTTTLAPYDTWLEPGGGIDHLEHVAARLGGLLLLMGVLHSLTIAFLPVLGLIFTDGWRRLPPSQRA